MKKILAAIFAALIFCAFAASFCSCGRYDDGRNKQTATDEIDKDTTEPSDDTAGADDTAAADSATEEAETTVLLSFIERVSGTYRMSGKSVYRGDEDHYYNDSGTNELDVTYDVVVKAREDGKADVSIQWGDGASNDEVAEVDEENKTITFKMPYAWGYEYDCTMTFDDGGSRVFAQLHMYVEGTNWKEQQVSEDIDLEGYNQ